MSVACPAAGAVQHDQGLVTSSSKQLGNYRWTVWRISARVRLRVGKYITLEQLDAIRAITKDLPIIVGSAPASIPREELARRGARILIQGHPTLAAVVKTLHDVYAHLLAGGKAADLGDRIASGKQMDAVLTADAYKAWRKSWRG